MLQENLLKEQGGYVRKRCVLENLPFLTKIIYVSKKAPFETDGEGPRRDVSRITLEDCLDWCLKTTVQLLSVPLDQSEVQRDIMDKIIIG